MKELLLRIIEVKPDLCFVEVSKNVVKYLHSGIVISNINILRGDSLKDGLYQLTERTCDGRCSINKPNQKCIDSGVYISNNCSVYALSQPDTIHLTLKDIVKLEVEMLETINRLYRRCAGIVEA